MELYDSLANVLGAIPPRKLKKLEADIESIKTHMFPPLDVHGRVVTHPGGRRNQYTVHAEGRGSFTTYDLSEVSPLVGRKPATIFAHIWRNGGTGVYIVGGKVVRITKVASTPAPLPATVSAPKYRVTFPPFPHRPPEELTEEEAAKAVKLSVNQLRYRIEKSLDGTFESLHGTVEEL